MMPPLLSLLLLIQATPTPAAPLPSDPAPSDWRPIPDDELMVITLTGSRQVVVRLAASYAPLHIANMRKLALAKWWDNTSIYRVQENWVAQWGGNPSDAESKPLPKDVAPAVPSEFEIGTFTPAQRMAKPDSYSIASGITADGWPVATDGKAAWLTHCYGMVGVARDADPTSGSGSELFTPIGQSARRLDQNYAVVGRIIEGMKYVSALPRSDAAMGVYATAGERSAIVSVRLASQLPDAERPRYDYRSADNVRFSNLIAERENPKPPTVSSGGANVCDVALATRKR